ncbi:MAG TPA: oxygen-independent coproporphyrinogen III oxidase [Planctomycetes bacterium]|nr:oxygen-independent coproporphyrinogen III oxidase [Planctomycetota bacterium]
MGGEALSIDPETILSFSRPGPRYTSYPTAPVWSDWEESGDAEARAAYRRCAEHPDEPLSLYIHLPFCIRRCLFCGCTVEVTNQKERVTRYLDALEREIDEVSQLLGDRRGVIQMHWGGGTPTHLDPEELRRVHAMVASRFRFLPGAEVSIEIHPHITTDEHLDTLFELGFNRISMGVQDTDPEVQAIIHRDQTVEETTRCVERCRRNGVDGINLDLMYGLPAQTEATFHATLDTVADLRPDRLAIYGYAHVPWLKKTQKVLEEAGLPGPVERARLFALAIDRLGEEGYRVIGLDHFALPTDSLYQALEAGTLARNFMGYAALPGGAAMGDMVAFGASAIGDVGGAFLQNARDTKGYEALIDRGLLPVQRGMVRSVDDDLRRAIILSIMCRMRLDLGELERELAVPGLAERFAPELAELKAFTADGFCTFEDGRMEVTPTGRLFLRHLAMVFDAYLDKKNSTKGRFSQTV